MHCHACLWEKRVLAEARRVLPRAWSTFALICWSSSSTVRSYLPRMRPRTFSRKQRLSSMQLQLAIGTQTPLTHRQQHCKTCCSVTGVTGYRSLEG